MAHSQLQQFALKAYMLMHTDHCLWGGLYVCVVHGIIYDNKTIKCIENASLIYLQIYMFWTEKYQCI